MSLEFAVGDVVQVRVLSIDEFKVEKEKYGGGWFYADSGYRTLGGFYRMRGFDSSHCITTEVIGIDWGGSMSDECAPYQVGLSSGRKCWLTRANLSMSTSSKMKNVGGF